MTTSDMTPADIRACTCGNDGYNNDGMFGGNGAWWIIILLLFGWGRNGFGGFGAGTNAGAPCATQADLAAGFNNSAVLSNLNDLALGQANIQQTLCQGFGGVNTAVLQGFHGVDNAICNLGFQNQQAMSALAAQLAQCCCDTRTAINGVNTGIERAGWSLSKQLSDCCCDIEKMNMQSRFDAQAYNCNTLQAIDKLGDRIIDYMANEKTQALRDEVQTLRLAASQANQNAFITANQEAQTAELLRRLSPTPTPAYVVPNPNCCYQYNVQPVNACGCGGF